METNERSLKQMKNMNAFRDDEAKRKMIVVDCGGRNWLQNRLNDKMKCEKNPRG